MTTKAVLVVMCVVMMVTTRVLGGEPSGDVTYTRKLTMPGVSPPTPEEYLCAPFALNQTQEEWVVKFDPLASANRAHHMLLYACSDVPQTDGYWDCGHHGVCSNGRIMYAWAQNAPSTALPQGVGFRIGGASWIKYLTLQIHYATAIPDISDHSGLSMTLTTTPLVLHHSVSTPLCEDHTLGVVVSGYTYNTQTGEYTKIAKGNPQWPQAFYPMDRALTISPQDIVASRCTYNSTARDRTTYIGSTKNDEMCNLYLMYYTDTDKGQEGAVCGGNAFPEVLANLPPDNDLPLPPNPMLEMKAHGENTNKNVSVTYKPLAESSEVTSPPIVTHATAEVTMAPASVTMQPKPITVEKKAHQYEKLPPQDFLDYASRSVDPSDYEYPASRVSPVRRPVSSWGPRGMYVGARQRPLHPRGELSFPKPQGGMAPYDSLARGRQLYPGGVNPQAEYHVVPQQPYLQLDLSRGMYYPSGEAYPQWEAGESLPPYGERGDFGGQAPARENEFKLHPKPVGAGKTGKQVNAGTPTPAPLTVTEYAVKSGWAQSPALPTLGQVTAVDLDSNNNVYIFHRGGRVWDGESFTADNYLANSSVLGPIQQHTILLLDAVSGALLLQCGHDFFYMPHGLTVDAEDNLWVTDVAMHQVFKFPPKFGDGKPLLTLGTLLEPGSDKSHFCKPAAVAVLKNGDFFVADGYCNSRVVKFRRDGSIVTQFGAAPKNNVLSLMMTAVGQPAGVFVVPHDLALAEDHDELCVADRENGRLQCYDTSDAPAFRRVVKLPQWGSRLFTVAYSPVNGGRLFCVNGPSLYGQQQKIEVFQLDFSSGQLLSAFSPNDQGFSFVHDVTVTADGAELYVAEISPNLVWKFTAARDRLTLPLRDIAPAGITHSIAHSITDITDNINKMLSRVTSFILRSLLDARPHLKPVKTHELSEASLHAQQILHGVGSGLTKLAPTTSTESPKWSPTGVSAVVLGLLAVPIIVLTSISLIIRVKKRGAIHIRSSRNGTAGLGLHNGTGGAGWRSEGNGLHQLGSSLLNKHRGFTKLATEDIDEPSSGDSDIEEFSQMSAKA
ncbi:peptidyl-glycine alpha-amidating monooxygenase B [Hyalella azteca]|uniref:Peptidyl-glycine alpha-amidating monooxygenase B n=1 Tax=Hyalella azteca TaxID=294128 RepID=A0A979FXG3_HYAAZ|nr:peptidyl-glycine alpha-amidating monooxygenase B [Hyalella azteca]